MKIAFIGMGNMAQALARGFIRAGVLPGKDMAAFAPNQDKLRQNAAAIGFVPCGEPKEAIKEAEIVFAACKPYQMEKVFTPLKAALKGKTLVSVASGWTFAKLHELLGDEVQLQYILPNTPAAVCKGVTIVESAHSVSAERRREVFALLAGVGQVVELPANIMSAASSVTGCGPAFAAMIIEGLADGAVKNGVPRAQAYELVAGMLIGAASLQLETGMHPGALKDGVCSPGGTTIKGVAALEDAGLRAALIRAVDASLN